MSSAFFIRAQLQLWAASSLFNKIKAVNETHARHPRGVSGIHAVTSLMTSHLRHSAVQSDTLPDGDTSH